jgi:aliphatic sulfonates family ABC transporter substrate-binding protein
MRSLFRRVLAVVALFATPQIALAQAPLRIGYQTGDINVQLMWAIGTGQFEKVGLEVKMTPFPAGPAMLPALAAEEIDISWMGEFPVVTGYANGMPIEVLMIERLNTTNVRLVATPASGINSLADLKGKKIAVSIGSTSHHHIVRALTQANLKQEDVTLVNLQPGNMPAAYAAGQIDAAFTWEPNIGAMEKSGGKRIATTESLGDITGGVWVGRSDYVKKNPESIQKFLKVWEIAMLAHKADPTAVRAFEAKRVNQSAAEFDDLINRMSARHPSLAEQLTLEHLGKPGEQLKTKFMAHLLDIGNFLIEQKRINALPADWSKIINSEPLQTYLASKKS